MNEGPPIRAALSLCGKPPLASPPLPRNTGRVGITSQQLARIQERLEGRAARRRAVRPETPVAAAHRILLGIDPSLRGTGYGVVRQAGSEPAAVAHGTILCPAAWAQSRCLARIAEVVREIIARHRPTVCVVEGLFHAQNIKTALIMGQARGAALAMAAQAGLPIYELAPRRVKQAVVGHGAAGKDAVARMIQRQLRLTEVPASDAADALAVALAFIQSQGRHQLTRLKEI